MKETVLYQARKSEDYHFYYDTEKCKFILDAKNDESKQQFYNRIGLLLKTCPLSDYELMKKGKIHRPLCPFRSE